MHKDTGRVHEYPALILAYIGDAVFELMVREYVLETGLRKVKDLHHDTVERVKAESQAKAMRIIYDDLADEEKEIVRRGRNTKSTPPKHADIADYRLSTGFEALIGYLYLKGEQERLAYLGNRVLEENIE